jgi:L-iditol 2-dehydrogenase
VETQRVVAPGTLAQVDWRPPSGVLADGEVLVDMLGAGICGSDLPFFRGHVSPLFDDARRGGAHVAGFPLHEVVGTVRACASGRFASGERVVGWATNTDAMNAQVVTREDSLASLPDDLDLDSALVVQPLACVIGTLDRLPDVEGLRVAVVGLGPFGLLFCRMLRERGAAAVVGVDRVDRSSISARFGIDEAVHSASDRWAATLPESDRFDLVVECVGHQGGTLNDCIGAVAQNGTLFCFGVPEDPYYAIPFRELFRRNATLVAGFVSDRRPALTSAVEVVRRAPELAELVTDRFPFAAAQEAFELALRPETGRLKVALVH